MASELKSVLAELASSQPQPAPLKRRRETDIEEIKQASKPTLLPALLNASETVLKRAKKTSEEILTRQNQDLNVLYADYEKNKQEALQTWESLVQAKQQLQEAQQQNQALQAQALEDKKAAEEKLAASEAELTAAREEHKREIDAKAQELQDADDESARVQAQQQALIEAKTVELEEKEAEYNAKFEELKAATEEEREAKQVEFEEAKRAWEIAQTDLQQTLLQSQARNAALEAEKLNLTKDLEQLRREAEAKEAALNQQVAEALNDVQTTEEWADQVAALPGEWGAEFDTGLQQIDENLNQIQKYLNDIDQFFATARRVRTDFNVPAEAQEDTQTFLTNYYGVWLYNAIIDAIWQRLNTYQAGAPYVDASLLNLNFVDPVVEEITNQQTQAMTDYQTVLQKLIRTDNTQSQKWQAEAAIVASRLGPDGTIQRAKRLASLNARKDYRIQQKVEQIMSRQEPPYPVNAKTGGPTLYVLTGIARDRPFENYLPNPDFVSQQNTEPSLVADLANNAAAQTYLQTKIKRASDLQSKDPVFFFNLIYKSAEQKQVITDPQERMLAVLNNVASKLGLRILNYKDPELATIFQKIQITPNMIQNVCGFRPRSGTQAIIQQGVITDSAAREIIDFVQNSNNSREEYYLMDGYVAVTLEERPQLIGLTKTVNRKRADLKNSSGKPVLKTTEIGLQQGVPPIVDQDQDSLEIMFLCADSPAKRNYPRVGVLLMLYTLVADLTKLYWSVYLDVVAEDTNLTAGESEGKTHTRVAAFYHEYFKFQRAMSVNDLGTSEETEDPVTFPRTLFHANPDWKVYELAQKPQKKRGTALLETMSRPYPTINELLHMIGEYIASIMQNLFPREQKPAEIANEPEVELAEDIMSAVEEEEPESEQEEKEQQAAGKRRRL